MAGLNLGAVAKGNVIASYSPVPPDPSSAPSTSRGSKPLAENGWLFYLDEQPGAFYEHPGRIVVVGAKGSILFEEQTNGWPTLNGASLSIIPGPSTEEYQNAIVWNPWKFRKPILGKRDWTLPVRFQSVEGAVVVDGLVSGDALYSEVLSMHSQVLADMQSMFGESKVRSVTSPTVVANPAARIAAAVNELATDEHVNSITIYMIAHGSNDSIGVGGYSYTVHNLRDLIEDQPRIKFCVILETCHGGSWLDNFNGTLPGYPALGNLGLFITTTRAAKGAYPDWDTAVISSGTTVTDRDTSDAYVEWTSDFLKRLADWTSVPNYSIVTNYASSKTIQNEWALYYHCYWSVKGSLSIPPAAGFSPGNTTYTLTEWAGVAVQSPQIYTQWTP